MTTNQLTTTHFRRDKGIPQLTPRDRYLLSWAAEQYAVRFDTLGKLLGNISQRNIYRIISRWETLGLAEYQKFWDDTPGWVWLTATGLRSRGMDYSLWNPRQGTEFEHLHLINEVRFRLEERYGIQVAWESERRLKKDLGLLTAAEQNKVHLPDAVIQLNGNRIAIQVEITQKSKWRIDKIISNLVDQYEAIWYFVSDATEPAIRRASRHSLKLKVYKLSEVLTLE